MPRKQLPPAQSSMRRCTATASSWAPRMDLPADVLHVVVGQHLPLEDGLAGVLLAHGALHAQAAPEAVLLIDTLRRALEHGAHEEARAGDVLHGRTRGLLVRRQAASQPQRLDPARPASQPPDSASPTPDPPIHRRMVRRKIRIGLSR